MTGWISLREQTFTLKWLLNGKILRNLWKFIQFAFYPVSTLQSFGAVAFRLETRQTKYGKESASLQGESGWFLQAIVTRLPEIISNLGTEKSCIQKQMPFFTSLWSIHFWVKYGFLRVCVCKRKMRSVRSITIVYFGVNINSSRITKHSNVSIVKKNINCKL